MTGEVAGSETQPDRRGATGPEGSLESRGQWTGGGCNRKRKDERRKRKGGGGREEERGQKKRPLRGTGSVPWITGNNHPY